MGENKCCGNCENYHANSNINPTSGICKEYEALVYYNKPACFWYCKKRSDNNAE